MVVKAAFRSRGSAAALSFLALTMTVAYGAGFRAAQNHSTLANVEVFIVRHAERQGEEDKLTPAGLARADAYARYFRPLKLGERHVVLTHLIAEKSDRTRRTLEPLAKAMAMALDTRFSNKQVQELAEDLRTHAYGREILICWHHGKIPALIRALGGDSDSLIPGGKWPKSSLLRLIELMAVPCCSEELSPACQHSLESFAFRSRPSP